MLDDTNMFVLQYLTHWFNTSAILKKGRGTSERMALITVHRGYLIACKKKSSIAVTHKLEQAQLLLTLACTTASKSVCSNPKNINNRTSRNLERKKNLGT
ncbi:hypothetical protein [Neisseria elongata]|uniref:hypothetical protein n=1 Tax=Neisseria elongata TaxID=495 RepID=UPI00131B7F47|nr:hypothetical protein [Neisseria elongata]